MAANPILRATPYNDSNGDGRIDLSPATCASLGVPQGTVLLFDGQNAADQYVYWVEGLPRLTVALPNISTPETGGVARVAASFIRAGNTYGPFHSENLWLAFKIVSPDVVSGLSIHDVTMTGCGVLLRKYGGTLDGATIERVSMLDSTYEAGVGRGVFMGSGRIDNLTIRDVRYRCGEPVSSPGDIYPAIGLTGKTATDYGANFLFEDIELDGFEVSYTSSQGYPNLDGFSIEKLYTDGVIRRVKVSRTADAGIDLKGERWRIEDYTAVDCHKSYKFWAEGHDGAIHSEKPRSMHLFNAYGGERVIDFFRPVSDNPLTPLGQFENNPGIIRVLNWDAAGIDLTTQRFARNNGAPAGSCKLILPDREIIV